MPRPWEVAEGRLACMALMRRRRSGREFLEGVLSRAETVVVGVLSGRRFVL